MRSELQAEVDAAGLSAVVDLPGFVANPYAFMRRARVFAHSSMYEGLPTVLVEAIACGTAAVSTDSAGGAREILGDGRFGVIVPQEDDALARAILRELRGRTLAPELLRSRAADFGVMAAVDAYERLLEMIAERRAPKGRTGFER
jgi:glycosyltransferase involved in cell wall biosynthesis